MCVPTQICASVDEVLKCTQASSSWWQVRGTSLCFRTNGWRTSRATTAAAASYLNLAAPTDGVDANQKGVVHSAKHHLFGVVGLMGRQVVRGERGGKEHAWSLFFFPFVVFVAVVYNDSSLFNFALYISLNTNNNRSIITQKVLC